MTNTEAPKSAKPPIAKHHEGRVNASVWEQTAADEVFHTVTFERRYAGKDGKWRTVHNYRISDLFALRILLDTVITDVLNRASVVPE